MNVSCYHVNAQVAKHVIGVLLIYLEIALVYVVLMVYVDIVLVIYQLLLLVPHNDYLIGGCKCPGGKECNRGTSHEDGDCTGARSIDGLCQSCFGNLIYQLLLLVPYNDYLLGGCECQGGKECCSG